MKNWFWEEINTIEKNGSIKKVQKLIDKELNIDESSEFEEETHTS